MSKNTSSKRRSAFCERFLTCSSFSDVASQKITNPRPTAQSCLTSKKSLLSRRNTMKRFTNRREMTKARESLKRSRRRRDIFCKSPTFMEKQRSLVWTTIKTRRVKAPQKNVTMKLKKKLPTQNKRLKRHSMTLKTPKINRLKLIKRRRSQRRKQMKQKRLSRKVGTRGKLRR